MNAPKMAAPTGQPYGARKATLDAQAAVPVSAPTPPPTTAPPQQAAPVGPDPGSLGGLLDPTARPGEPLTAGLATGPGVGPEGMRTNPDASALDQLRILYRQTGSPALLRLLESGQGVR